MRWQNCGKLEIGVCDTKDRKSKHRPLFPTLGITDLLTETAFGVGDQPVHGRIFLINRCQVCSIFGLHSLNNHDSYFPNCDNQDVSRYCQMSLGDTNHP